MRTETEAAPAKGRGKKGKTNGHAGNGVAHDEETLQEVAEREAAEAEAEAERGAAFPEPGAQGIATQEEEPAEKYEPHVPTQQELTLADDVYHELQNRAQDMGAEAVISALISLVDTHRNFITPDGFPGKAGDESSDEVFAEADVVAEIARFLCRGCPTFLQVPQRLVVFCFKDHEKWTSAGKTVEAQVKRYDGFHQWQTEGMLAAVIINYHHWRHLNPRQKVFVTYHALRELDEKGGRVAADWAGYFEEPGLFGAGVHNEMVTIARSFVRDAKERVGEVYQLSILAGIYD